MMRKLLAAAVVACFGWRPLPLRADVKLPAIFSDNMVLQAAPSVPIWGWATPGEKVTIHFGDPSASTSADAQGKWRLTLDLSRHPAAPRDLTVSGDQTRAPRTIKNVVVGEVWLAGGQSNMEKPLGPQAGQHPVDDWEQEVAHSANPDIRVFTVVKRTSDKPLEDCQGQWEIASPQTTARFTAAGYFFARELNKELRTPVGIIHSSWGGTRAETWTSLAGFAKDPELAGLAKEEIRAYENYPRLLQQYHADLSRWAKVHHYDDPGNTGEKDGFADPATSTADWQLVNLGSGKKGSIPPGVRWYRKDITIPPEWEDRAAYLHLGVIAGFDTVYFNNKRIGGTDVNKAELLHSLRRYLVPAGLMKPGPATIAVRVLSHFPADAPVAQAFRVALVCREPAVRLGGPWRCKSEVVFRPLDEAALKAYPAAPPTLLNFDMPTFLFNGMIHPLLPYRIAGCIWYQGESNAVTPDWVAALHPDSRWYHGEHADLPALYRRTFPALINDWRAEWQRRGGQRDFPFYYCQLANYGNKNDSVSESKWAEVREAQRLTLQTVPRTGMAVLIDVGQAKDIHPTNKQVVGRRLALQALAQTYGRAIEYSGPLYESMTIEGRQIRVKFSHVAKGLVAQALPDRYQPQSYNPATLPLKKPRPDSSLQGFAVCGAAGKFAWADARIDGDTVVVSAPEVSDPTTVRYAWADNPTCNLYNTAGLPASPFRTDP